MKGFAFQTEVMKTGDKTKYHQKAKKSKGKSTFDDMKRKFKDVNKAQKKKSSRKGHRAPKQQPQNY